MSTVSTDAWSKAKAIFDRHAIREQTGNSVFICRVHDDGRWDAAGWAHIALIAGPNGFGNLVITGDFDHLVINNQFNSLKSALAFVAGRDPDDYYLWTKIESGMFGCREALHKYNAKAFVDDVRKELDDLVSDSHLSSAQRTHVESVLDHIEQFDVGQREAIHSVCEAMPDGGDWHEWISGYWGCSISPQVECALAACCRAHELLKGASQGQGAEVSP